MALMTSFGNQSFGNQNNRMIFTCTPGRSGTMLLANLCALLPGVISEHEPKPLFSDTWFKLREQPELSIPFLKNKKKMIDRMCVAENANIYLETCHLACKGFFEPMVELRWKFECIFLIRAPRKVATSLYQIGDIPARTQTGRKYYLHPEDPNNILRIDSFWKTLTDYQLCYWYVIEMEKRAEVYRTWLKHHGVRLTWVLLEQLTTLDDFRAFVVRADLPTANNLKQRVFDMVSTIQWNYKATRKRCGPGLPANVSEQEAKLLQRILTGDKQCKL